MMISAFIKNPKREGTERIQIASRERVENWREGEFRALNETGYIKFSIKRVVSRYRTIMLLSRE